MKTDNAIRIDGKRRTSRLLPMGGEDRDGNIYQADNISLLKNGRRILPVVGEFHFSRYEADSWEEALLKMRAGGVDIVATYVFWIHHEEKKGEWDFQGCRNLREFLSICQRLKMPVWLRIGPWAHGECRNGGFSDWLVEEGKEYPLREDNPVYLEQVRRFWGKIEEQVRGMMCRDGGPVLGVQLENEYGHAGGPSDPAVGMAHMRTLKRMAQEAGFEVPYYTATGWGGAYVPDEEFLAVLGGYVDAPWSDTVEELPASSNFLFAPYIHDENIGSDWRKRKENPFTFDIHKLPYLTAELGGGMQVTAHRRVYPWAEDIQAQAFCALGSGANMLGYYMYHGGINPQGRYTTLQESRDTGYANDLPVKSYDFQAPIRQSGRLNRSYGALKKMHLFLHSFGELLAGAVPCFADVQPKSPEDLHTLRVCARVNMQYGVGFLFINNHQRKRKMEAHRDCSVKLYGDGEELILSGLWVESASCGIYPFRIPAAEDGQQEPWQDLREVAELLPRYARVKLLCRLGSRVFYVAEKEERGAPCLEGGSENTVFLREEQAERAFLAGERLVLLGREGSCLIEQDGGQYLLCEPGQEQITVYEEYGEPRRLLVEAQAPTMSVQIQAIGVERDAKGEALWADYRLCLQNGPMKDFNQVYLEMDYEGDRAEVWLDGKLVDDWFTTGEKWYLALRRFGYPERLEIRIYPSSRPIQGPFGSRVYYDLPVREGCALREVRAVPEVKLPLTLE